MSGKEERLILHRVTTPIRRNVDILVSVRLISGRKIAFRGSYSGNTRTSTHLSSTFLYSDKIAGGFYF